MVKDMFAESTTREFVERVNKLDSTSTPEWGKMNVSQMLRHCAIVLDITFGEKDLKRPFVSYLFGKMALKGILKDVNKPLGKNSPTHKELIIENTGDFEQERENLIQKINKFHGLNQFDLNNRVHPFFGKMNIKEWNITSYKHLDHHLTQFNV